MLTFILQLIQPCCVTMAGTSADTKALPGADRQQTLIQSRDCAPPAHKIGYSYNHSSLYLNRVRVGSTEHTPTLCKNSKSHFRNPRVSVGHEPLGVTFRKGPTVGDFIMGNATSTKDHYGVDERPAGSKEHNTFHKRRKNAYLTSFLGSSKPSSSEDGKSTVSRGLFGNLLKEVGQDRVMGKKKRGRSKLKTCRYSEPSPNIDPLLQSAKRCHMPRVSVPNEDDNFAKGQQCRDNNYANCDVKLGRSYNDRLYQFDQRFVQCDATTSFNNSKDLGSHVYENMDFYVRCKNKNNSLSRPFDSIKTSQNKEDTYQHLHTFPKDESKEYQYSETHVLNNSSSRRYRDEPSVDSLFADSSTICSTSNSANTLCYNSTIPSLIDVINAIGDDIVSETDASGGRSGCSSSLANMNETFLSGSVYFSINELHNESKLNEYLDDHSEVNECEDYSYFSFYADIPPNVDQSSQYAGYSDYAVLDHSEMVHPNTSQYSNYVRNHIDTNKSDAQSPMADLLRPQFPCSDTCSSQNFNLPFEGNLRLPEFNVPFEDNLRLPEFSVPIEDTLLSSKSEPQISQVDDCVNTRKPIYENWLYRTSSENESIINSSSSTSQNSRNSNEYFTTASEDDDSSDQIFCNDISRDKQLSTNSLKLSKSATDAQVYQHLKRIPGTSISKKPPQPPARRARDNNCLHEAGQRSRIRSRSASFHRKSQDGSKQPASFGYTNLWSETSSNGSDQSQESICDEPVVTALSTYIEHAPSKKWLAERKKIDGNEKYTNKEYRDALLSYTKAIELCPDCAAYYSNRSACYMMLGKYTEALADARESVRLDAEFVKGYLRVGKCNIALGDANAALSVLRRASDIDATKAVRDEISKAQTLYKCLEDINKFTAKKEYRTAVFHIEKALLYAVACQSLKISKAENLVLLQRFSEAESIVNDILQSDGTQPDAIYVRGLCLYYQDNQAAAFTHFQHVLRLAPDHKKAKDAYKRAKALRQKKDAGNQAFNKQQWHEAISLYTDAISVDSSNKATLAKLYFNRATATAKLDMFESSIKDCTEAIARNEDYVKAYIRRAKSYQAVENHEEAVRDVEKANKLSGGHEYDRMVRDAKMQLKRSKRKDYYKILGISKTATDDEIKKAYRKKALLHHPDRHANSSEKERRGHEVQFKEIGEAYAILTDAKKRSMFDNGHDINDGDDFSFQDAGFDPSEIFQAFFSSGGGGGPFGGHSGRQHFNFSSGSGPFNFMG